MTFASMTATINALDEVVTAKVKLSFDMECGALRRKEVRAFLAIAPTRYDVNLEHAEAKILLGSVFSVVVKGRADKVTRFLRALRSAMRG